MESTPKPKDVLFSAIRDHLRNEFQIYLKNVQIQETCRSFGFRIVSHAGYPKVKSNPVLLERLLRERKIREIV